MPTIERTRSAELFAQAQNLFPGGVNSPVRAFKAVDGIPLFIRKGKGAHMIDEDGNRLLDFCCSWGPLILGHCHPSVMERIADSLKSGTSFGAPTALGNELGNFILSRHPYIERMRFVSSGTEAVMSALRLARGITGKTKILKFEGCYHGHVDSLLVKAGSGLATFGISSSPGVPQTIAQDTLVIPLDNISVAEQTIRANRDELAAVIIEPIPANNGLLLQRRQYLRDLRTICTDNDVLLIFDEVISGFRIGFAGAAGYYDIQPDIITFGKVIGGGMPVGAFAGSHRVMRYIAPEGDVYQAGTLSANPIAMAAGLATLEVLIDQEIYPTLEALTQYFIRGINDHIAAQTYPVRIQSIGSIFWIAFANDAVRRADQIRPESTELFKNLHLFLLNHGIYLGPSTYEVGFISSAHTKDDLSRSIEVLKAGLDHIFA